MLLCMFHPLDHPLERGWVGRIDGQHVVQLATQTLQSFFTGGGGAREHAVYALEDVCLLAPVLHPPAVRVFESQGSFAFANPAAIVGPRAEVANGAAALAVLPRLAAVVGAEGELGGTTILAEWRDPRRPPPKDRDFALGLGPVLVTLEALETRSDLHALLRELPERDRLIIRLRFVDCCTQGEIGEVIGVSQMQVSRLLCRIIGDLRDQLDPVVYQKAS